MELGPLIKGYCTDIDCELVVRLDAWAPDLAQIQPTN